MAMAASSFRPPYAVICWSDDNNIYIEIPMKDPTLPGYVTRYPLSEGGLSSALNALRRPKEEIKPTGPTNYTTPRKIDHPAIRTDRARERLHAETTESQREMARKILEKLGMKS